MYELFFEENPYLNEDSKKIHFFSNGKSWNFGLNNSNNGLNIIFKVAKEGLRPLVPFENRNELSQWADIYLFNNYTNLSDEQKKQILDGVELFVSLMEKCWSQDPSGRPKFSEIFNDLKKIKKYFQQ
ncbi:predicted protein [Naegleria gruberi]|uniref:Predicted protein n=1 Tax=Naegleria gruberi TaxID=5762 RepID=D2W302_NAEGR|nr:uncharacterized protein NAEGRDRAFT_75772 [Naegleria gruberi]EFC36527.1 predicted protein [Naegleria gruberi]|eukprot:XP_002669271.1 predicted protein [Naegleria gruberi strain NEG-M]